MPKWEYRIELIDTSGEYLVKEGYYPSGDPWADDAIQAEWAPVNDLGAQGWEMVSASWEGDEGIAVFKRELKEFAAKIEAPPTEKELTEDGEPIQARKGLEAMKRRFRNE